MPNFTLPIIRNFENYLVDAGRVNVGRVAVSSEVLLSNIFITREDVDKELKSDNKDNSYMGIVNIDHLDSSDNARSVDGTEDIEPQAEEQDSTEPLPEEKLETVSNKYIYTGPAYKQINDESYVNKDPYPNESPLLPPN